MHSANTAATSASLRQDRGSYITFKAGHTHFALSAQHVRYITAKTEKTRLVHRPDGKQIKIFEFDGQSVSCFQFSELINAPSYVNLCSELSKILTERKQDHINWLNTLENSLVKQIPFIKATDPHLCAFGKWYDTFKSDDEDFNVILEQFDAPHKRLHTLAEELLELNKTNHQQAMSILANERSITLRTLLDLFDDAINYLTSAQRPVALILETKNHLVALELDHIEDLITLDNNLLDHTGDSCHDMPMDTDIVQSFYQHKDSPLYLVLDVERLVQHLR